MVDSTSLNVDSLIHKTDKDSKWKLIIPIGLEYRCVQGFPLRVGIVPCLYPSFEYSTTFGLGYEVSKRLQIDFYTNGAYELLIWEVQVRLCF